MLQIIGTKSCPDTRKALRFCAERSIACQFVDLRERELSKGEWQRVFQALDAESLVDTTSPFYIKEGYAWREYDAQEELRSHPALLRTPLLKTSRRIVVGYDADFLLKEKVSP